MLMRNWWSKQHIFQLSQWLRQNKYSDIHFIKPHIDDFYDTDIDKNNNIISKYIDQYCIWNVDLINKYFVKG